LCRTFSNCASLLPDFLPRGLPSTAVISWSGLRFWGSRVVLLALVEVVVVIALFVIVALGEAIVLLVPLASPPCHHVT
jgi:hypothetical protein